MSLKILPYLQTNSKGEQIPLASERINTQQKHNKKVTKAFSERID
jgi:hypothetical protein